MLDDLWIARGVAFGPDESHVRLVGRNVGVGRPPVRGSGHIGFMAKIARCPDQASQHQDHQAGDDEWRQSFCQLARSIKNWSFLHISLSPPIYRTNNRSLVMTVSGFTTTGGGTMK